MPKAEAIIKIAEDAGGDCPERDERCCAERRFGNADPVDHAAEE